MAPSSKFITTVMGSRTLQGIRILGTALFILSVSCPCVVSATPGGCGQASSEAEIRSLLEKWRNQIKPGLPAQEVKFIENQAAVLPLDMAAGQFGLSFEDSETDASDRVEVRAGRRDMAYALAGYGYTLVGGSYAGQQQMKDLGLWAFLEAALTRMIPQHLLNVSFHLNERKAYDDAAGLLCYALSLDPSSAALHNNLAYNLAAQGQFKDAVTEAAQALSLAPETRSYLDRLKFYGKKAGIKVDSLVNTSQGQTAGQMPYSQAYLDLAPLILQKYLAFNLEYFGFEYQGLIRKSFSGQPGSFDAIRGDRLLAVEREGERCQDNCGPKGILTAGLQECICRCGLAAVQKAYAAEVEFYRQVEQVLRPVIEAATKANDQLNSDLGAKIEAQQKALKSGEFTRLAALLDDQYFNAATRIDGVSGRLNGVYGTVLDAWKTIQDRVRECRSAARVDELGSPEGLFGKRPPRLKRVIRESDKPWVIWFFFGELKLGPGDNMRLTLGRPGLANLRFKFNFQTLDFGTGVSLGLNACKLLGPGAGGFNQLFKFELFFMGDTEKGISYGLDAGIRTRKVGAISMGDQSLVTLEN